MNRSEKYHQTVIERYGSWEAYQSMRKERMIGRFPSEKDFEEHRREYSSRGGKLSTSRPFKDVPGLAKKASKSRKKLLHNNDRRDSIDT